MTGSLTLLWFFHFDITEKPPAATLGISDEKIGDEKNEDAFGLAEKRSVLSYQQPILATKLVRMHLGPPPNPVLLLGELQACPMCRLGRNTFTF